MERGLLALPLVSAYAFTGIVLAGGRSSRMGRDKASLVLAGRSLLDIAIARLAEAGARRVWVSGNRPSHGGVPDRVPELGPVGGLASVLEHCPDGPVVVVPVDMPGLGADSLSRLRDALPDARAVHFRGHPLPCALMVDGDTRGTIAARLATEPRGPSMRSLMQALGAVELEVEDGRQFANVNTPADWTACAS